MLLTTGPSSGPLSSSLASFSLVYFYQRNPNNLHCFKFCILCMNSFGKLVKIKLLSSNIEFLNTHTHIQQYWYIQYFPRRWIRVQFLDLVPLYTSTSSSTKWQNRFPAPALFFWCIFSAGSHYIVLASLELVMLTRLAQNSQRLACHCLKVSITGV